LNDYTTSELLDELGSREGIDVIELQADFNIDEFRNSWIGRLIEKLKN